MTCDIGTLNIAANHWLIVKPEGAVFWTASACELTYDVKDNMCFWSLFINVGNFNSMGRSQCTGILSLRLPVPSAAIEVGRGMLMSDKDGVFQVKAMSMDGIHCQFDLNNGEGLIGPHLASPESNDRWVLAINGSYRVV